MRKVLLLFVSVLLEFCPLSLMAQSPRTETFTVNGVSFTMVYVEGGTFMMGCTDVDNRCFNDALPVHQVTLTDYYIGETEVTRALWSAVMYGSSSVDDLPQCANFWDAKKFIQKLNTLTGRTFRLPTEAEWEYAARGGNKSQGYVYSGSNTLDEIGWYYDNSYIDRRSQWTGLPIGGRKAHAVKGKRPNELGLYDMSGNLREWCSDIWSSNSYSSEPQINPTGPIPSKAEDMYDYVGRGGYYKNVDRYCTVYDRQPANPRFGKDGDDEIYGLRLVLSL